MSDQIKPKPAPVINAQDGGQDWAPLDFLGSVGPGEAEPMRGFAKRVFAVMCPEAIGLDVKAAAGSMGRVLLVHLPTGKHIATVKNGARAFELADELLGFPEFGRPFELERIEPRIPEVLEVLRRHGVEE